MPAIMHHHACRDRSQPSAAPVVNRIQPVATPMHARKNPTAVKTTPKPTMPAPDPSEAESHGRNADTRKPRSSQESLEGESAVPAETPGPTSGPPQTAASETNQMYKPKSRQTANNQTEARQPEHQNRQAVRTAIQARPEPKSAIPPSATQGPTRINQRARIRSTRLHYKCRPRTPMLFTNRTSNCSYIERLSSVQWRTYRRLLI